MSKMKPLTYCANFVSEKIRSIDLNLDQYVTTDNLLQNKKGIVKADSLPANPSNVTRYVEGDILLANIRPYLKKIWYADICGGCSADVLTFRAKSGINPKFLYYALFRDDFFDHVMRGSKGTKMPRGDKNQIMGFLVPDYAPKTQQKIAAVLSALDAKIECNNRINAELEVMAKTLYDYWFVQFNFPDHNGQPYKSSGGKMVYNSTLKREIPAGWESVLVGDVLSKVSNSKKVPNKEILIKGKLPVIDQSMDYIGGFTDDENARLRVESAHIVFGDHTRILKLINFDYARGADGTQVLISKIENIPAHLFFQMLSKIDLSSYGYARHFKFLKESLIILPNKDIARKYEAVAKGIYRKIKHGIFENQHLSQLRDWLLPMLMNGQVTVV